MARELPRVLVTRPIMGICNMQVCCVKKATDDEILKVCNSENPSGTSNGWSVVNRGPIEGAYGPVQCADFEDRLHILVSC